MSVTLSKVRTTLAKKSVSAIKKSKHNRHKKPYSEVHLGLSQSEATDFMADFRATSDTKKMTKWDLGPEDCDHLLPDMPEVIEGVKFDGKVLCLAGTRPYIRPEARCAEVESLEVKYKPSESMITLKFRTRMHGFYA